MGVYRIIGICCMISFSTVLCTQNTATEDSSVIRSILLNQQNAWNEGDLEKFMDAYWRSDKLSFVGASGISYGWDQVLENYKKSYPNREEMGVLEFELKDIKPLGEDVYLVLGKYTLHRKFDMPDGYFTLIWKKIDGSWKIISDHTSSSVKGN